MARRGRVSPVGAMRLSDTMLKTNQHGVKMLLAPVASEGAREEEPSSVGGVAKSAWLTKKHCFHLQCPYRVGITIADADKAIV